MRSLKFPIYGLILGNGVSMLAHSFLIESSSSSDEYDFGPLISMAHLYVFQNERMLAHWTQVRDCCPLGYLLPFVLANQKFMYTSPNDNYEYYRYSYPLFKVISSYSVFSFLCSSPKPVFNGNRRGFSGGSLPRNSPQLSVSPQHEEIVKYLSDGQLKYSTVLFAISRGVCLSGWFYYRSFCIQLANGAVPDQEPQNV